MIHVMRALSHRLRYVLQLTAIALMASRVVIAVAPYVDAMRGASAASHVEAADTSLHYAHGDDCLLCAAQHVQSSLGEAFFALPDEPIGTIARFALAPDPYGALAAQTRFSRAPPRMMIRHADHDIRSSCEVIHANDPLELRARALSCEQGARAAT
jgi:hypothetical protein